MPGIPQESNAVFYHPLDDLTEALQAQPWAGRASPRAGKVPPAQGPARALLSFGPLAPFSLFTLTYPAFISSDALSATKIVSVCSGSPPGVLDIRAASVSGTAVSYGPPASINTGGSESSWPAIAAVSGTKFVVAFGTKTYVGTVAGLDVTMGPAVTLAEAYAPGNEVNCVRLAALSPTLVAAVYRSSPTDVKAALGSVSGTAVTWSAGNPVATVAGDVAMEIVALDATHVLVAYFDITPGTIGLKAGAVSGPALLFTGLGASTGSANTSSPSLRDMALVRVGASTAALVYRDGPVCARVATVSGIDSDVSLGLPNAMSDPAAADCETRNISHRRWLSAAHDGSELAIFCHVVYGAGAVSGSCNNPYEEAVAYVAEIRDGLIAERGASGFVNFGGGEAYSSSVVALSGGAMVWTGLTGTSTPKSLTVSTADHADLALAATAPGAYQTAVGAGKLAFAMWTKPGRELLLQGEVVVEPSLDSIATKLSISPIDSERAVVAYRNGITDSRARVLVLSGGGVTVGPASVINAGNTQGSGFAIAALGNTLVATYIDTSNDTKCKVGSVSGTDITWGAAAPFEAYSSGYTEDLRLHVTGPSTLVAVYLHGGASAKPSARVGTLSGLDLTWGARQETPASVSSPGGMSSSLMGASGLVVSWRENTVVPNPPIRVQTATIAGNVVSFGTATTGGAGPLSGMEGALVSGIDSDRFLIVFRDNQASAYPSFPEPDLYQVHAMVGTVSGGAITLGDKTLAAATDSASTALARLSPSRHAMLHVWRPEGGFGGRPVSLLATVGRVSGAEPLFAGEIYALAAVQWAGGAKAHEAAVVGSSLVAVYISPDQTKVLARAVGVPALVAPPAATTTIPPTTAPPPPTTTAPPLQFGAPVGVHDNAAEPTNGDVKVVPFGAGNFGVFFVLDSGYVGYRLGTRSGLSVAMAASSYTASLNPAETDTAWGAWVQVVPLSSTKAVMLYTQLSGGAGGASGDLRARVATFSGPDSPLSWGGEYTLSAGGSGRVYGTHACPLDSARFLAFWRNTTIGTARCQVFTVISGTVVIAGPGPTVVPSAEDGFTYHALAALSSSAAALGYVHFGADWRVYVRGVDIDGGDNITYSAAADLGAVLGHTPNPALDMLSIAALTGTDFVVGWGSVESGPTFAQWAKAFIYSGGAVTQQGATLVNQSATATTNPTEIGLFRLAADRFAAMHYDMTQPGAIFSLKARSGEVAAGVPGMFPGEQTLMTSGNQTLPRRAMASAPLGASNSVLAWRSGWPSQSIYCCAAQS
jgi:hypothetical protein